MAERKLWHEKNGKTLRKAATRVTGLDMVLCGGLPAGRMTLINGGPGSGKSILGLQCLCNGAVAGEPGILVLLEERAEAVRRNARSLGWDVAALERKNRLYLLDARINPEAVVSGDFSIQGLLAILDQKMKAMRARRLVIDAVDVLLQLYDSPKRERKELYALHEWLLDRGVTTLMTAKTVAQDEAPSRHSFLDFMADCVIHVDQRVTGQVATRRLRVIKFRGSAFGRNEYPFVIGEGGVHVMPITGGDLQHRALGTRVSAGQPQLDALLAGGYRRGASILLVGTSGAGKTTLACSFAQAAGRRGERVLYLNFEESAESMVGSMMSPGLKLRPLIRNGMLKVCSALPEAMGVEEHLFQALKAIQEFKPQHVVVDAITACKRMGSEHGAFEYLMRLLNDCRERSITCLYLNQATGLDVISEISGIGISSVIDTVILLRQQAIGAAMKRDMIVVKSRGSSHSDKFHPFSITDRGIRLGEGPGAQHA